MYDLIAADKPAATMSDYVKAFRKKWDQMYPQKKIAALFYRTLYQDEKGQGKGKGKDRGKNNRYDFTVTFGWQQTRLR